MASYPYTGRLTDFTERTFRNAVPRLWVAPSRAAMGVNGPLADRQIPVELDADSSFTVRLTPSVQTSPPTTYILRCDWLTIGQDGQEVVQGWSEWSFVAAIGGGRISDMTLIPITSIWVGKQPPRNPAPGLQWLDTSAYPYEWKEWIE